MRIKKKFSALSLLLIFLCLCLVGCKNVEKTDVETAIVQEMDKLKSLDAATAGKYISSEALFPNLSDGALDETLVEEFVSNFFQDFNYKILDIEVKENQATANLRLDTLDAQKLARDFSTFRLQKEILEISSGTPSFDTLSGNYEMLNSLMEKNAYKTVENNCTMHLKKEQDTWNILRSGELENEIAGSFISYITNPNLLTPDETADIYLSTIASMEEKQLITYLGLSEILTSEDSLTEQITSALFNQALNSFDYELGTLTQNGYQADLEVDFTTFDSGEILKKYESKLQDYLETPDALYAGKEGRDEEAHRLLIRCIEDNTDTTTLTVSMKMVNNGISWTLTNPDAIGSAIFGTVVDTWNAQTTKAPTEDNVQTASEEIASDFDYNSDSDYNSGLNDNSDSDSGYSSGYDSASVYSSGYDSDSDYSYDYDSAYDSGYDSDSGYSS